MAEYKIGFVGTGNIATAIFSGVVGSGYIKPNNVYVFDPVVEKTAPFTQKGANLSSSALDLTITCDFVFLTIKPQIYEDVLKQIKPAVENTCFVDVAAGITISFVKQVLGENTAVVRVMPNTPLMYGVGASALVKDQRVTEEQFNFVKGCFDCSGVTAVVNEEFINTVTAISGSAPAYIMQTMKCFIDFAVNSGLEPETAEKLVLGVFSGTAKMAECDPKSLEELIRMVTSPNGTTEAGLKSLAQNNFNTVIENCLTETVKRAEELSK